MLSIPEMNRADVAFGNIKHMPKFSDLPPEYRERWHDRSNVYCHAISQWFYKGAESADRGIKINGVYFNAKPGVDTGKALAAIKAVLGSYEPKHEHKIAACGFMLSEWFDAKSAEAGSTHPSQNTAPIENTGE